MMPDLPASCAPLLAAGATLAELAEPNRDLLSFGADFQEIATTLQFIGDGLCRAHEEAEDRYERIDAGNVLTVDLALLGILESPDRRHSYAKKVRAKDLAQASGTALRTAKKALVDLAALIGEIEIQQAADALRRTPE